MRSHSGYHRNDRLAQVGDTLHTTCSSHSPCLPQRATGHVMETHQSATCTQPLLRIVMLHNVRTRGSLPSCSTQFVQCSCVSSAKGQLLACVDDVCASTDDRGSGTPEVAQYRVRVARAACSPPAGLRRPFQHLLLWLSSRCYITWLSDREVHRPR